MNTRFTRKQVSELSNSRLISLWRSFKHSRQYKTSTAKDDFLTIVDRERILDELCCRVHLLEKWIEEDNKAMAMSSAHELGEAAF